MSSVSDGDRVRSRLYEISKRDIPFKKKARKTLELGGAYLGVDNGYVTRINPEADYWEVIVSTDPPDGTLPPGRSLDLSTTYCRRTIAGETPIALHDAPEQGWTDDPAFDTQGLHCYHGTTLEADDEPYGTVCFVSEDPREEPFGEDETSFAELVTRVLEHELEYNRQKVELVQRESVSTVLSRVLRHNLRNDMSVIRGHVLRLANQRDDRNQYVDTVLNKIDNLLDLSDTARTLESVVGTRFDRRMFDLHTVVDEGITVVESRYPSASFVVEGAENATVAAMPSLHVALEELLENAAKHAQDPQVTVSVGTEDGDVQIHVTDNGPGLPEQERKVLEKGVERVLVHGSGLGLWMVYEIVTAHDGTLDSDVSETGTRMTITLPRTSVPAADGSPRRREVRELGRFEAVFDGASAALLILDDDARILEANSSAGDLYGLASDDLLGRSLDELLHPEHDFEREWRSMCSGGRRRGTVTIVAADGRERVAEYATTANVLPGQHLAVMRDVSARSECEQEHLEGGRRERQQERG
ncbi:ATP-binding protein [Haloparvum sp. AD34]